MWCSSSLKSCEENKDDLYLIYEHGYFNHDNVNSGGYIVKKFIKVSTILLIILFSSAVIANAGGRYYSTGYKHYGYSHHGYHGSHYNSDDAWVFLGVGLLTGALFGAIANSQPRERTVVYQTPPQIIYTPQPVIAPRVLSTYQYPEMVLGQVETTTYLLNVRSIPDQDAEIIDQLTEGSMLDVIGAAPEWLYIKTSSGQYGWIMKRYTRPDVGPVG